MQVVIPTLDFDFNSRQSSPQPSAPSSPKCFGNFYCSAPTSPRHLQQLYRDFDDEFSVTSAVPFDWESKPGTPKSPRPNDDFAFDVSGQSQETAIPAEDLFAGGKIRPLKPPPKLQFTREPPETRTSQIRSPKSPISSVFSPRKKRDVDPFEVAAEKSRRRTEQDRRRQRGSSSPSRVMASSRRRGARSLSPYRVSEYPWEEEEQQKPGEISNPSPTIVKPALSSTSSSLSSSSSKNCRKWRFKDFFLFRSASEGRAADKDPLKKYSAVLRKHEDDAKNSSFRSAESSTGSRRRGRASAHELHYTVNRAVSEDMKKKTFLPYKQGILGRLAFNPAVHALANGFGFSRNEPSRPCLLTPLSVLLLVL
ncbi:hypothetical protein NMG60_11024275 [Bertholletia excelsa]